jgi:hypothetical protein
MIQVKSANQLYKESKSEMPFKDWLKSEQSKGVLADHDKMFNANGDIDETNETKVDDIEKIEEAIVVKKTPTSTSIKANNNRMLKFVGIISLGLIVYGLYKQNSQQSVAM